MSELLMTLAVPLGLLGLVVAAFIYVWVRRQPAGSEKMMSIALQIQTGAAAFLRREYSVLIPFVLIVAVLLYLALRSLPTSLAFLGGATSSMLAGLFGMNAATRANVRTAEAARDSGQGKALLIAFNGGAVMGLAVASLGLLGVGIVFAIYAAGLSGPDIGSRRRVHPEQSIQHAAGR